MGRRRLLSLYGALVELCMDPNSLDVYLAIPPPLSLGDLLTITLISSQSRICVEELNPVLYDQSIINFPSSPPFENLSKYFVRILMDH